MRIFNRLSEAITFISTALETNNFALLEKVSRDPLPPDYVLHRLKDYHQVNPFSKRYEALEFPRDSQEFKLGGHQSELGHIHIDFVKTEVGWALKGIWMCR